MTTLTLCLGLFCIAFVAATFLPMQSEAALVALLLAGTVAPWLLVAIASLGNIAGSVVNWLLGREVEKYKQRKWFPVTPERLERAKTSYRRYGRWSLLLSWMPVIGDPITIAAGLMREKFSVFLGLVSVAKTGRYTFLALATLAAEQAVMLP